MKTRTATWLGVAVLISTTATLGGCGAGTTATVNPAASTAGAAATENIEDASSNKMPPSTATLGGSGYTFEDGLVVNVSTPKVQPRGQYAAGGKAGDRLAVVTVKVTNKTDKAFDTALASVNASYGADGDQAEQVFDSANGIESGLEGTVGIGKSKSAKYAFAIPKSALGEALVIEVTPGFEYTGALFEGKTGK